jgi:hypothetical protein
MATGYSGIVLDWLDPILETWRGLLRFHCELDEFAFMLACACVMCHV